MSNDRSFAIRNLFNRSESTIQLEREKLLREKAQLTR
jgi:hypothetical protein